MKKDAGSSSKGLSLTDFAKGKQHDAAVVRKIKRQRLAKDAKLRRGLHAALKAEGYEPEATDNGQGARAVKGKDQQPKAPRRTKDRFNQAKAAAQQQADSVQEVRQSKEERDSIMAKKLHKRKALKRKLTRKTARGQPILKHKIGHMLDKIQQGLA